MYLTDFPLFMIRSNRLTTMKIGGIDDAENN